MVQAMSVQGFALFDTAIGPCGAIWGEAGIVGMQFPEIDFERTRRRMQQRFPGAMEEEPSPAIQAVIDATTALLAGEYPDLSQAPLDMSAIGPFERRVYEIALTIPAGRTVTYGDIARQLGDVALSRAVGQALGKNPFAPVVPCHRVLAASGKAGGFSARGGLDAKARLLTIERAATSDAPNLFDDLPTVIAPRRA
jgi:methylated-DNA-[protein]-cysteine S-methyltransferase